MNVGMRDNIPLSVVGSNELKVALVLVAGDLAAGEAANGDDHLEKRKREGNRGEAEVESSGTVTGK